MRSLSQKRSISQRHSASLSHSRSVSQAAPGPDYIVTNAGTAAANGNYYENGAYNGLPAYEKDGGGAWLFYSAWGGLANMKAWAIAETKTDLEPSLWYYDQDDTPTPPVGTYADGGYGADPNADVAAG